MLRILSRRPGHYCLLLAAGCLLFLPGMGSHALWDIDEAHNAECAREMALAGDWLVPTFNFQLRTDKPVLLYWLLLASYHLLGVAEWSARLCTAMCALGSMLATYEIGRSMFGAATGVLAGLILGSSAMFCVSAHAVTPDAVLILCTTVTLAIFWNGYRKAQTRWMLTAAFASALAVLAKGPVGLVLPSAVAGLFLLWERRLGFLLNWRLVAATAIFVLVAAPWYVLVGIQTQGEFLAGFFFRHNVSRFLSPMEGHSGSVFFHPAALCAGFAPWSVFLGLACWYGSGRLTDEGVPEQVPGGPRSAYRFLWCWIGVWLVFFSLAGTKLPNYVLPAYPSLAILTGRFLTRWRAGDIHPLPSLILVSLVLLAGIGVGLGAGLLMVGGALPVPVLSEPLAGFAPLAAAGLIPLMAALACWGFARYSRRTLAVAAVAAGCVLLAAILAGIGPAALSRFQLTPCFAQAIAQNQFEPDIQIGYFRHYQPSLVYYTQRQMRRLATDDQALYFLQGFRQAYLLLPEPHWRRLAAREAVRGCHVVARHRDLFSGRELVLVTNRTSTTMKAQSGAENSNAHGNASSRAGERRRADATPLAARAEAAGPGESRLVPDAP